jgi:hypothetical protein
MLPALPIGLDDECSDLLIGPTASDAAEFFDAILWADHVHLP